MPKTTSAKKALRQNIRRRGKNIQRGNALKTAIKETRRLMASGKKSEAGDALRKTYKTLDKMAKIGFIKKGKANRLKSRLSKQLSSLK